MDKREIVIQPHKVSYVKGQRKNTAKFIDQKL